MRITFILPPVNMSGGIRVATIYARALAGKGHDVTLVSPPQPRPPLRRVIKSLLTGKGWPGRGGNSLSHVDGLGLEHRVLDRYRTPVDEDVPDADVIIATWWETAEWVNALSEAKGAKVYFIQHHEVHEHLPVERSRATYLLPMHKIVIAKWLLDVMRNEYGDTVVDLVPNSVDHGQFYAKSRGKQPVPTVGFLFSHAKFKGVDVTMQALRILRRQFPELRIISFGSVMLAPDNELAEQIEYHHLPPQNKIRDLYAQCDVWLTASRTEGFNLPAMEAMACRTPVVSTRAGWPEEAVVTGHNGALVDVDDVDAFAQAASSILSMSNDEWTRLSRNAYDTVANSTWEASSDLFEKALYHACERAAKGEIPGQCLRSGNQK